MKAFQLLLIGALIACINAGCVSSQTIASADYGQCPANIEELTKKFIAYHLKDPDSAMWRNTTVRKGWVKDGLVMGGRSHFGWICGIDVNARNSFGGYTGFERYYIFFEYGSPNAIRNISGEIANMYGMMAGFAGETPLVSEFQQTQMKR